MIKDETSGKRPLFKPKDFKTEERRMDKFKKKNNLFGTKEDVKMGCWL